MNNALHNPLHNALHNALHLTTSLSVTLLVHPVNDRPSIHLPPSSPSSNGHSLPDNVWRVDEDEDQVVQGIHVNDVDLDPDVDSHQVAVEISVDHGTFTVTRGGGLLFLEGTRSNRTARMLFRGTLRAVNRALQHAV